MIDALTIYVQRFQQPDLITSSEIKRCAREVGFLSSTSTRIHSLLVSKLADLKRLFELVAKYSAYNTEYEKNARQGGTSPHLIDALFTGWTGAWGYHSIQEYSPQIEKDIKDLVRLSPQCLESREGQMRLFGNVSPLFVACLNKSIPVDIVEFLLGAGADMNAAIDIFKTPIIKAIYWVNVIEPQSRALEIQDIFRLSLINKTIKKHLNSQAKSPQIPYQASDTLLKDVRAVALYRPSRDWDRGPDKQYPETTSQI